MNEQKPSISVVVTMYNNEQTVAQCLEALLDQSIEDSDYEIVVVSDGSTDRSDEIVTTYTRQYSQISLLRQDNNGVAAARNQGISHANADIILVTQADIITTPDLVKHHLEFHQRHSEKFEAAVGFTTWSKELTITPFMEWLEDGGPQFAYHHLSDGQLTNFETFYTTNVSLKRQFLIENGGFNEQFKVGEGITAYEDSELGFRLEKARMKLTYLAGAIAYHKHEKNLQSVLKRRYFEGWMAHRLHATHPDMRWNRRLNDAQLFWISIWLINPIVLFPLRLIADRWQYTKRADRIFKLVCRAHYNLGYWIGYLNRDE